MKVYIDKDERFPVYDITYQPHYFRREIEVDEAIVEQWLRVWADFEAMQDEMMTAWGTTFS